MKTLLNLTLEADLTTAKMLKDLVTASPQGQGMDVAEMRNRMKVLDAIDAMQGEEIKLEDAVYETAKQCVKETRFVFVKPHILKFAEQFGL